MKPALESSQPSSHTLDRRQASTMRIRTRQEASKSGDKDCTGSPRSGALRDCHSKREHQPATTSKAASLAISIQRKRMFSTTGEAHFNYHGTTITVRFLRSLLRVPTTARCSFSRTQIWFTQMPILCSPLPYGST